MRTTVGVAAARGDIDGSGQPVSQLLEPDDRIVVMNDSGNGLDTVDGE